MAIGGFPYFARVLVIRTSQRQGDKFHALPTHDGPTETTVVPPVPDVELVPTVGTEWDI